MNSNDTTHRLDGEGSLCGQDGSDLTPYDGTVSCPTCLALLELAARRRRHLVRRSVRIIGRLAIA